MDKSERDSPVRRLIRDRGKLRKLGDMNRPETEEPYDPTADVVEHEWEGGLTSLKQEYDPDVSRLSIEFGKLAKQAQEQAWAEFVRLNPEAAELKRYGGQSYLSKARPKGSAEIPPAIVRQMMIPGWISRTQDAIRAEVASQFPQYSIPKETWRYEHKGWQLKKLRAIVSMGPVEFNQADVSRCKTLGQFKEALKIHVAGKNASNTYKATITVTPDTVTINKLALKVSVNRVGGKEYRRVNVNIDKLLEALKKPRG